MKTVIKREETRVVIGYSHIHTGNVYIVTDKGKFICFPSGAKRPSIVRVTDTSRDFKDTTDYDPIYQGELSIFL